MLTVLRLGVGRMLLMINMVEAAGVEPASEKVVGREPTYVVAFRRRG